VTTARLVDSEETLDNVDGDVTSRIVGVDVKRERNDSVDTNAHGALEVVALSVLDQVVDNQHGDEEDHSLEALEVESHGLSHDPAEDDEEGSDEERNLQGRSDGDVDSEVHLALVCDDDGGDMLGSISDNRDQDQTDKCFADVCGFDNGVDAVDKKFGADGDEDGDNDQCDTGSDGRQDLGFLLVVATFLVLDIGKKAVVRVELEVEV